MPLPSDVDRGNIRHVTRWGDLVKRLEPSLRGVAMLAEIRSKLIESGYVVEQQGDLSADDRAAPACIRVRRETGDALVVIERSDRGLALIVGTSRGIFGTTHYRATIPDAIDAVAAALGS